MGNRLPNVTELLEFLSNNDLVVTFFNSLLLFMLCKVSPVISGILVAFSTLAFVFSTLSCFKVLNVLLNTFSIAFLPFSFKSLVPIPAKFLVNTGVSIFTHVLFLYVNHWFFS